MDDITAKMLTKALEDLSNMVKFQEEFTGVLHNMVLNLYNQTNTPIPKHIKEYEFQNKNPWSK